MRNPEDNTDVAGRNGFVWWIGIVESRNDPLKLGRCQVRIGGGWHSDNRLKVPTKDLPWATACLPINNPNPYAPKEGDMVMGFFLDGQSGQQPVIFGLMPSIPLKEGNAQQAFSDGRTPAELSAAPVKPDEKQTLYPRKLDEPTTSRLARNDTDYPSPLIKSKKDKKSKTFEYPSAYKTIYPYNNVLESESGHAIEIDDTLNSERLHFYHRKGSYQEYRPDGTVQTKVVSDSQQAVDGNKNVYVKGNYTVNVDGNLLFNVKGSITGIAGSSISTSSGSSTSMTAGTTWSALGPLSASMTSAGQATVTGAVRAALTSFGWTGVTGTQTSVTGNGTLDCNGAVATYSAKGVATLAGATVNIIGKPVGGEAVPASIAEATQALVENVSPFEVSGGGAILFDPGADYALSGIAESVQVSADGVVNQATSAVDATNPWAGELQGATDVLETTTLTPQEAADLALPSDTPVVIADADGAVLTTTDGQYTTITDTYKDGTLVQFTSFNETGELVKVDVIEKSALDKFLTQAENVGKGITDAASKVDVVGKVEDAGKTLAQQITQPFLQSGANIENAYGVLTNDAATMSQKWNAAKTIIGEGLSLTQKAASISSIISNPQALLVAAGTSVAQQTANDFSRELTKTQAIKDFKGDIQSSIDNFTQKVKDTYKDTTNSLYNHVQNSMNDFALSSPSVSAEVAQNLIDLRSQGFTEADLRQIMPDVIKRYPKQFAAAYGGDPITVASAFDQENGGV